MKILCTICARSQSKGLKNKNIKKLYNQPLINYSIKQAIGSKIFDDIVISTDSTYIEKLAIKKNLKTIGKRPKYISNDTVSKLEVIRHAVKRFELKENKKFDVIFDLDITSPLRLVEDIINSFLKFKKQNANNLITVCESRKNPYFNMIEVKNNNIRLVKSLPYRINSRQKAPLVYNMNASIYIWKRSCLFSKNPLFNKKTIFFEMPFERSIDIDNIDDFEIVKYYLKKNISIYKNVM